MVTIRAAVPADSLALALLVGSPARVGGAAALESWEPSLQPWSFAGDTQVAEDEQGLVGAYCLHRRNAGSSLEGELLLFAVTPSARRHGVDRLLLRHLGQRAGATGLMSVYVIARPPHDAFLRGLGAEPLAIEAPAGGGAGPAIRLSFSVSDLTSA